MSLTDLAPDYIRAIDPYVGGKPIAELARERGLDPAAIVKLASNENPLGMGARARAAVLAQVDGLARYTDDHAFELKAKLAAVHRVAASQIVLGNGSNDVLSVLGRTVLTPADSVVYSQYCFALYPLITRLAGARGIEVRAQEYGNDLPAMLKAIEPATKIVFIANPNNPTGTLARAGDIVEFMEDCPGNVLVVLDEAYIEFLPAEKRVDSLALLRRFPNLVVTRTFSKAHGMAGLRMGYALCAPELAELMNRVRQPFNVNALAQAAAIAALDDIEHLRATVQNNFAGLRQLSEAFGRLSLPYIQSYANFVTFHCGDARALNEFLLERGVIVRPLASYGMTDSLRVSIGTEAENARFIEVLAEAMGD